MTLTTILIVNVTLDLALLVGLAFVLTRPGKLTPHRPGVAGNTWRLHRPHRRPVRPARDERVSGVLSHAFD